jgi:hypothetical protein
MKRIFISLAAYVLLFGSMAPPVQSLAPPMMPTTVALQTRSQPDATTFLGTVLKDGDHFVLSDSATKSRYALDNAEKASHYEGKTVTVTGTIEIASNLIHIETIQEIA